MALCKAWTGRWTDRLEDAAAWILLAAGLLVVLVGSLFGIGVHDRLVDQARAETSDHMPAIATLLHASPTIGSDSTLSAPLWTAATWRDRSGEAHTGTLPAPQGLEAGQTFQIWINRAGAPVPEPITDTDAVAMATVIAAVTFLVGVGVLAAVWGAVRRITLSCNCAAWEREWREVAVIWSPGEGGRG